MTKQREERCDPRSVERGVRQLLADKVSGTSVGLWLLIPEYLRLGVWDLLRGWCGPSCGDLDPRLGLQLVNEAALCVTGIRQRLSLSQRGFELACGLPFVASDTAIHQLLERHTVEQTQELQVALGLLRRQAGDFKGAVFAIDPHRIPSSSKRQMRRFKDKTHTAARKQAQTFFCLDADTNQPLVFTTATATRTASHAAVELMALAARILPHTKTRPVILADTEHLSAELFDHTIEQTPFDLLTPQSRQKGTHKDMPGIPESQWNHHWAGYATTTRPYRFVNGKHELHQLVQRENERTQDHIYKTFIATAPRDELQSLTRDYPNRWHIEQFFDTYQHLGWNRAGTMDLNIRYGHMTTALIAQAAIERLRRRLGAPYDTWEAPQLARHLFSGIDGDIRVRNNTVVVTFYNAPNLAVLRQHYQHLPQRLRDEDICPNIPWLYDLPLEFRFR
jgi:hypothetical protein